MKTLKQSLLIGMNLTLLAVVLSPLAGTTGQWVTLGLGLVGCAALFGVYRRVVHLERSQKHAD
ncbi:hypothetical protein [Lactiplantibacillus mudanjiangensis]|uniref:Uncharacterized protein n=1 Tax=Lactiplantibacillus mudanjiangensis TaxID=1296538 RepID=A0A660DTU5_9LACO|nr:hypothetical protein [Lactiplantibacillus mudanjiangensis]VDG21241.1 hypothetical protein [Lactobacillus sp. CBA3605] [Lactiplantibacillus mudanjiangensis]VDG22811.1 hypothetical protein [Lactobacillus sp. CBA3605] [Lactiplantibacillus mudanjiangensis]VDG26617.1 hypothetical protein [Lactobacillus sp. CBA3605] [Lactiplantibacillus mudanjiangensis]VDG31851.1 hypothetical protein [Lactobacillus sp. CBA3605] [Lactiplantibacillus mudanjiangensis]